MVTAITILMGGSGCSGILSDSDEGKATAIGFYQFIKAELIVENKRETF